MKKQFNEQASLKLKLRLIRFLSKGAATIVETGDGITVLVERVDAQRLKLPHTVLREALSDGLLLQKLSKQSADTMTVFLSDEGALRAESLRKEHAQTHQKLEPVQQKGSIEPVVRNDGSPLARLYFSKRKELGSWLSKEEYHAGERLRVDFEKSHVSPNLGVNWHAFGMPRAPSRGESSADKSDFADAARVRLSKALTIVGPEMADLLLDVCCFLKGLEAVETERGWPRRSAKLLLKVALATLDRHYHPKPIQNSRRVRAWHTETTSISV